MTTSQIPNDIAQLLLDLADWKLPPSGVFYPNADGSISDRPAPYDSFYANGSVGARTYWQDRAKEIVERHNVRPSKEA